MESETYLRRSKNKCFYEADTTKKELKKVSPVLIQSTDCLEDCRKPTAVWGMAGGAACSDGEVAHPCRCSESPHMGVIKQQADYLVFLSFLKSSADKEPWFPRLLPPPS